MSQAKILSEQDLFRNRVICIALAIAFVFSFLGSRLWYLQVIEHEEYQSYAEGNRIFARWLDMDPTTDNFGATSPFLK